MLQVHPLPLLYKYSCPPPVFPIDMLPLIMGEATTLLLVQGQYCHTFESRPPYPAALNYSFLAFFSFLMPIPFFFFPSLQQRSRIQIAPLTLDVLSHISLLFFLFPELTPFPS